MLTREELLKDVFVGEWSDEDIRYVILKMLPNIKSQEALIKWTFYHYGGGGYSCNHENWGGNVGVFGSTLEILHQHVWDDKFALSKRASVTKKFNINFYGKKIST